MDRRSFLKGITPGIVFTSACLGRDSQGDQPPNDGDADEPSDENTPDEERPNGDPSDENTPDEERPNGDTTVEEEKDGPLSEEASDDLLNRHGIEFDRRIDVVDDFGIEPYGGTVTQDMLDRVEDGSLLVFPEGRFRWDPGLRINDRRRIGFLGVSSRTEIVVPPDTNTRLLYVKNAEEVTFENFVIDQRNPDAVGAFLFWVQYYLHIQNIRFSGRTNRYDHNEPSAFNLKITDPEGRGTVRNWVDKEGSGWANYNDAQGRIGALVRQGHLGTIRFANCDLREFGNNGLYASRCEGNVQVFDSYFENNNVASVRIGGEGSFVENSKIVVSEDRYSGPRENEEGAFSMRGVLIEENHAEGGQKAAGAEIRGCEFVYEDNPTGAPAIEVWSNGRSLAVEDTTIRFDASANSVINREDYSNKASHPAGDPPRWLRMDNVTITGTGIVHRVIDLRDANDSRIRDCCVSMPMGALHGVHIVRSENVTIKDTHVDVQGQAVDKVNSNPTVDLLTNRFSCSR